MPYLQSKQTLDAARAALSHRLSFAEFLAKLSVRDRTSAQRRVTALQATPDQSRSELWQRLACGLMTLAPFSAKLIGSTAVRTTSVPKIPDSCAYGK